MASCPLSCQRLAYVQDKTVIFREFNYFLPVAENINLYKGEKETRPHSFWQTQPGGGEELAKKNNKPRNTSLYLEPLGITNPRRGLLNKLTDSEKNTLK